MASLPLVWGDLPYTLDQRREIEAMHNAAPARQVDNAEVARLRAEVATLRAELRQFKAALPKALGQMFAEKERKIRALEQSRIKYCGIHEHGVVYAEGSMVTRAGSLWYATKETREAPGEGVTSWTLAVKRDSAR